jgi:thiosulfate dehydrogenase [quinone] large subunit
MKQNNIEFSEPPFSRFLFGNTKMAWFWLLVRLYVGYQWVEAGWGKVTSNMWVGGQAGTALRGFLQGALVKASGAHPDVQGWYAGFIQDFVIRHAAGFGVMIAYGELLVGIALILGIFTGIAAFFGTFMNLNYLLAGTVSINPVLLMLQMFLILAWRVAGWYGADRWTLPALGTPWQKGQAFK